MTRPTAVWLIAVIVIGTLSGCSGQPSPAPTPVHDDASLAASPPVHSGAIVHGWPSDIIPILDGPASDAVLEICPAPVTLLTGDRIEQTLPPEVLDGADIHACGFTETPGSTGGDLLDEVAFSVDSGGRELLDGYIAHGLTGVAADCIDDISPILAIEYNGEHYGVLPGSDWCPSKDPESQALLDNLVLTEIVRDTITFEEWDSKGY
jgi:hypothetical protein